MPTALRTARGNPSKRPINHDEPVFELASPEPPEGLTGRAREEWEKQAPGLIEDGVLTVVDLSGFETFCRLVGDEDEFQRLAANEKDPKQKLRYESHLLKLRGLKKQYAAEYGFTPSSRSQVKAKKPMEPADERRKRFLSFPRGSA